MNTVFTLIIGLLLLVNPIMSKHTSCHPELQREAAHTLRVTLKHERLKNNTLFYTKAGAVSSILAGRYTYLGLHNTFQAIDILHPSTTASLYKRHAVLQAVKSGFGTRSLKSGKIRLSIGATLGYISYKLVVSAYDAYKKLINSTPYIIMQ